jgi:DNA repair exonuclease SbcCD ATPase subunit
MGKSFCRRCLLDEIFEADEYKNMQDYISSIDKHIKTEEIEYRRRLEVCTRCDNLINGMCRICGCFVEMRAAVKKNYCPDIEKKW